MRGELATGLIATALLGVFVTAPVAAADPAPPETAMNEPGPVLPIWHQFEFHGTSGSHPIDHFECRLDDGPWETCTDPWDPELTGGDHEVAVRAVDTTGLADPSPATLGFFIDVDAPTGQLLINGGATTTGRLLVHLQPILADRSSLHELLVSNSPVLDGDGRLANASPMTEWELERAGGWDLALSGGNATAGSHTVYLQASDLFGNWSPTLAASITYDPDAPGPVTVRLAVTQNPAPIGGPIVAYAVVHADDGATIRDGHLELYVEHTGPSTSSDGWTVETGDWLHLEDLPPGTHTIKAVYSGSDELDGGSKEITLKIGPSLSPLGPQAWFSYPGTSIDPQDPQPFVLPVYTRFNSATSFQCRRDGSAWESCNDGYAVPVLEGGWHLAEVRGVDGSGRVQAVPDTFIWWVMPATPNGDFTISPVGGSTGDAQVFLSFTPPAGAESMRVSNDRSLDAQGRLANAQESPAVGVGVPTAWSVTDQDHGGSAADGNKTISVQWQLGDGTWTKPVLRVIRLDRAAPVLSISVENGSAFVDEDELLVVATTNEAAHVAVSTDPDLAASVSGGEASDGLALLSVPVDDVPAGTVATRHLYARAADNANNLSSIVEAIVTIDRTSPTAKMPVISFDVGSQVTRSSVNAFVKASATDTGSGVKTLAIQRKSSSSWSTMASTGGASASVARSLSLTNGSAYRSRGVDRLGHVGAWATTPTLLPVLRSDGNVAITYAGGWTTRERSSALGDSVHRTKTRGATASFSFSGRAIGIIAPKGLDWGRFEVSIDGVKVATIDLKRSSERARTLVFSRSWAATGAHTIVVRNLATSGRPAISLDGFVVVP
jgi:hypothetical protein